MEIGIIIPARLASRRLPNKVLLAETGKPLIQHTYEAASASALGTFIGVATDSREIMNVVREFGGTPWMTSAQHRTGTDRIAERRKLISQMAIVVNVQADEPEITGNHIDRLIFTLQDNPHVGMATLVTPIATVGELVDASTVKVVFDDDFQAMYFSRSLIPAPIRGLPADPDAPVPDGWYRHIGVYAYRSVLLLELASMKRSSLERTEGLEQLRALQCGKTIQVVMVDDGPRGINTAADYRGFVEREYNRRRAAK